MSTPHVRRRAARFVRPDVRPNVELTERDLALFLHIYRRRFMRASQLVGLVDGTENKIAERLGLLFRTGYVDRVRDENLRFKPGAGGQVPVYGIARQGVRELVRGGKADPDSDELDWGRKNREATRAFVAHTVAVAGISAAFTCDAVRHPGLRVLEFDELVATLPTSTSERDHVWKWGPVPVPSNFSTYGTGPISNVPDHVVVLLLPDGTKRAFFIENDEGSMPIARSTFNSSSVLRKLIGYHVGYERGLHTSLFGWKAVRFLMVMANATRVENTLAAIRESAELRRSAHRFWITDKAALDACEDIYLHRWRRSDGFAIMRP